MIDNLSSQKTNGNGVRAKAIEMIQSAFPILSDEQLVDLASFASTHKQLAETRNFMDRWIESMKGGVKS